MLRSRASQSVEKSVVAILLVGCLLVPSFAAAAEPPGADSPQALVARLNAAAAADDFGELAACLAPEDRAVMTIMMAAMGGMMIAFMGMGGEMAEGMAEGMSGEDATPEQKAEVAKAKAEIDKKGAEMQKRYESIMSQYGLDKRLEAADGDGAMAGEGGPDPAKARELLKGIDDIALLRDLMGLFQQLGEGSGKEQKPVNVPKNVSDYVVEGDTATAKSGDETVQFVKVEGRWYFNPDDAASESESESESDSEAESEPDSE